MFGSQCQASKNALTSTSTGERLLANISKFKIADTNILEYRVITEPNANEILIRKIESEFTPSS